MYLGKGRAADYNRDAKGEDYVPPPQSGDPIDRTLPHGAEISAQGLIIPHSLDAEQWKEIGTTLGNIHGAMQWAIGDWWAYGHKKYGERKATAIAKKLPYEFGSLMNMGRVSRSVTTSFRNEALSYSHHVAVAGLEPDDQKKYLDRAVKLEWSVNKLQGALAVRRERAGLDDILPEDRSREEGAGNADRLIGDNSYAPDTQASLYTFRFLASARRAQRALPFGPVVETSYLDDASDATVAEMVEAASQVADLWSAVTESLKEYQHKRAAAGRSRSARALN